MIYIVFHEVFLHQIHSLMDSSFNNGSNEILAIVKKGRKVTYFPAFIYAVLFAILYFSFFTWWTFAPWRWEIFFILGLTQGLAKGRLFKNTLIINCDQKSRVKDNNIYIFAHTYVCDVNVCVYVCAYVHKYVHTKSLLSGLTNSGVTGATTFRAGLKDNWTPKSLGPELHQLRMYPEASGKTSLSISCSLCL